LFREHFFICDGGATLLGTDIQLLATVRIATVAVETAVASKVCIVYIVVIIAIVAI
jgi:hypothetical protein